MPDIWMDVDAALAEVPVNRMSLIDDTDFKTRETGIVYNQAGMDLVWNFVTTAGAFSQTAVTPTEAAGDYDWTNQGDGMYTIEIPASGGASINNDTEGFGWFTGFCTGVLPWCGPTIGFRASALNDLLIDSAYSATRGLAGTALPNAAADAAGGLPISDAGGLDIDAKLANTNEVTAARMAALTDWINGGRLDLILDIIAGDVVNIDGDAMRGTDSANTTVPDAAGTAASLISSHDTNIDAALATIAGYIDAEIQTLLNRLTAARAGYLDNLSAGAVAQASACTEARLAELDAANLPADIDILIARLTAARAGYIDNLSAGAAALASVCTEARLAALTDWIDGGRLDLILDIIAADVVNIDGDAMRGTDSANTTVPDAAGTAAGLHVTTDALIAFAQGDLDTLTADTVNLLARLTAARAGYLDKLNVAGSLAEVGSEMALEDDAITSAKYDESTAFPVSEKASKAAETMVLGTVSHDNTPATTTVFYCDDITEATADHYKGRIVIFTSGALKDQATDITDYALDTGEGKFTVTALTEAPADDVTFVIV